ncbi:hypothetical protein SCAR479_01613 [Seiridium cardinale]|uniref:UrcA family protein n=1 Tax=Seiridium cardinale TaxID=138064 RepID=A0ABR2Y5Y4_9PEZI
MRFLAIITPFMAAMIVAQPVAQPVDQPVEQSATQIITSPPEFLFPPSPTREAAAKLRAIERIEAVVVATLRYTNVGSLKERIRQIALAKCEIAQARLGGALKFKEYCYGKVYPATLKGIERRSRFNPFEPVLTESTENV